MKEENDKTNETQPKNEKRKRSFYFSIEQVSVEADSYAEALKIINKDR